MFCRYLHFPIASSVFTEQATVVLLSCSYIMALVKSSFSSYESIQKSTYVVSLILNFDSRGNEWSTSCFSRGTPWEAWRRRGWSSRTVRFREEKKPL